MTDVFTNRIPRDRNQRPGILQPPDGRKTKYYRRTTKFISQLENTWNLDRWGERMVALGMGMRDDLVLAAASLTAEEQDKDALDKVADAAKEHARASQKSTKGTALHKICERIDRGEDLSTISIPEAHKEDVEAYLEWKRVTGVTYELIECMRVHDAYKVAGTPDRTGYLGGKCYIIDLKTGDIDWNDTQREIAQQLAMYAHSKAYDPDQEKRPGFKLGRFPDPTQVDQLKAVVIHLPAGEGRCESHWVDIQKGWEGIQISKKVWDWRNVGGLFVPFADGVVYPPGGHLQGLHNNLTYEELAMQAASEEELRYLWRKAADSFALHDGFKIAVQTRLAQLKGTPQ